MTTTLPRGRRTSLGLESFVAFTDVPVTNVSKDGIEFAGDLTEAEVAEISLWLDATDDADQERRAQLRADREPLGPNDPQRRIIDYLLGDST
jgi:hypothetical protein